MAFTLTWSPSAHLDLKDIAAFIAESNPSAAEGFVRDLLQLSKGWPISRNPCALCLSLMTPISGK